MNNELAGIFAKADAYKASLKNKGIRVKPFDASATDTINHGCIKELTGEDVMGPSFVRYESTPAEAVQQILETPIQTNISKFENK